jgi:hypothetical protein
MCCIVLQGFLFDADLARAIILSAAGTVAALTNGREPLASLAPIGKKVRVGFAIDDLVRQVVTSKPLLQHLQKT